MEMEEEDGMAMAMAMAMAKALSKYEALVPSLPYLEGLGVAPYRRYGNFWYPSHLVAPILAIRDTFVARPTDIILATMLKSGTTWLKALVFSIVHRGRHAPGEAHHPLLGSSPHDLVPFLHSLYENHRSVNGGQLLDAMPSPRVLAVHAPFSVLQASVAESKSRVVYLCRDPKDVVVSCWHFIDKIKPLGSSIAPIAQALDECCDGVWPLGPVWDHIAEYWNASVARPDEVMFLRYEHLKEDAVGSVTRLAEFLGYPFTGDEVASGVPQDVVALCSMDRMASVSANKDGMHGVGWSTFKNSAFFRKGEIGDWREHMTADMARRLDDIVEEKLRGSGLSLLL